MPLTGMTITLDREVSDANDRVKAKHGGGAAAEALAAATPTVTKPVP